MKNQLQVLITLLMVFFFMNLNAQDHTSKVQIARSNEVLFELQDSGGDYTGFWTMNDGLGHMSIKLGIDGNGNYAVSNDGAAEILWGAHSNHGYVSLNAAKTGTFGGAVNYGISLIVDSHDDAIKVLAPNNSKGAQGNQGKKIADAQGTLFTDLLESRTATGLTIDMKHSGGDLNIYDAAETKYILGDQAHGDSGGIVLRTSLNPGAGKPLFIVESSGFSERLRVEHDGALKTTNYLEVDGTGKSYINGALAVNGKTVPTGYDMAVYGKILTEEVNIQASGAWPDYVFSKNYNLKSLEETESYIKEEGHLPNIPSADEVAENGIQLGEMNAKLLEKIEELTLHLIDQNKSIDKVLKENQDLKERVDMLEEKNK